MRCNDCTATRTLASKPTSIALGSVLETDANLYVYVERTGAASRTERYDATSDSSGDVSLTFPAGEAIRYNANHCYVIYLTLRTAAPSSKLVLTLPDGETASTCYALTFDDIYVDGQLTGAAETLQVE